MHKKWRKEEVWIFSSTEIKAFGTSWILRQCWKVFIFGECSATTSHHREVSQHCSWEHFDYLCFASCVCVCEWKINNGVFYANLFSQRAHMWEQAFWELWQEWYINYHLAYMCACVWYVRSREMRSIRACENFNSGNFCWKSEQRPNARVTSPDIATHA